MKTYCGLEYSSKIKTTIINTINEAKENIFSNYLFIVDDPLFFEEAFFKYTDTLFNIQIINYQDLIKQLINNYQLHKYEKLTKLDKILITKTALVISFNSSLILTVEIETVSSNILVELSRSNNLSISSYLLAVK